MATETATYSRSARFFLWVYRDGRATNYGRFHYRDRAENLAGVIASSDRWEIVEACATCAADTQHQFCSAHLDTHAAVQS